MIYLEARIPDDPQAHLQTVAAIGVITAQSRGDIKVRMEPEEPNSPKRDEQLEAKLVDRLGTSLDQQDENLKQLSPQSAPQSPASDQQPAAESIPMKQLKQSWISMGLSAVLKVIDMFFGG